MSGRLDDWTGISEFDRALAQTAGWRIGTQDGFDSRALQGSTHALDAWQPSIPRAAGALERYSEKMLSGFGLSQYYNKEARMKAIAAKAAVGAFPPAFKNHDERRTHL